MRTTNRELEGFLNGIVPALAGPPGRWRFTVDGADVFVLTDETHDRMRIMTPIADGSELPTAILRLLLEANFDRALDAKYALSGGFVWSVYVHPLSLLTKEEVASAVDQVLALRRNFGTTYASTDLVFGSNRRGGGDDAN